MIRATRARGGQNGALVKAPRGFGTLLLACALITSCVTHRGPSPEADRARLLQLHAQVMEAHRIGNVELILSSETDSYVIGNRGAVTHPTIEQRRAQLGSYLASTRFAE